MKRWFFAQLGRFLEKKLEMITPDSLYLNFSLALKAYNTEQVQAIARAANEELQRRHWNEVVVP